MNKERVGRRGFLKTLGGAALGAGLSVTGRSEDHQKRRVDSDVCVNHRFTLPGRLGNPERTLLSDERLDPRIRDALSVQDYGDRSAPPPSLTMKSTYAECLRWIAHMEESSEKQHPDQLSVMPVFPGIDSYEETIVGVDGNRIRLFIDRPRESLNRLPCVLHIHGGGMCFSSAKSPLSQRWRKSLAERGLLVIGVEFRNAGGKLGNHPFPAGLNDCSSAVQWAYKNKNDLKASHIVIAGESGGGNLAIATALKVKKEAGGDLIRGIYAMAPMILGLYESKPVSLMSWQENLGYQGSLEMVRAMTLAYDPDQQHELNPLAWPFNAKKEDLQGLPTHMILNYELDLIRDDGAVFSRRLNAVGVPSSSIVISGAHHVPEIAMPDVMPELTNNTLASLTAFVKAFRI